RHRGIAVGRGGQGQVFRGHAHPDQRGHRRAACDRGVHRPARAATLVRRTAHRSLAAAPPGAGLRCVRVADDQQDPAHPQALTRSPMAEHRPFTRSRTDRWLAGVLGGIAQRFGWNATLLRIVYVVVSIASVAFPGILVYLILWLLMPEEGG